jgi:hypothetical protein
MAEYVLQDKDKAAFINKMNKVLSQLQPGLGVDNTSFIDVPEQEDEDKCIFVSGNDVEEKVLDQLIDRKAFNFKVKKINVNEILREIKRELGEVEYPSGVKYIPKSDKLDPDGLYKGRTYFAIPINSPEPSYDEVTYNRSNSAGEYDFTFGPNVTGAHGMSLKYVNLQDKVWSNGNSRYDTVLVKDKAVADRWVEGFYNGGYKNK